MLERFGLYPQADGTLKIVTQQAVDGVVEELSQFFGYNQHHALIKFTAPGDEVSTLRRILNNRISRDPKMHPAIDKVIERLNLGIEIGGVATYTGDLELGFNPKPYYIVFISNATRISDFPFTLGEEITHGEHETNIIEAGNITHAQYKTRFQELTEEFLGYIGRKRIIAAAGLEGNYPLELTWERNLTRDEWAHLIGYYAVDDLLDQGKKLPVVDLFHAPDETRFWQVLLEAIKDPVVIGFNFPKTLRLEKLIDPVNQLVADCKAEKAIQINFSYLPDS